MRRDGGDDEQRKRLQDVKYRLVQGFVLRLKGARTCTYGACSRWSYHERHVR